MQVHHRCNGRRQLPPDGYSGAQRRLNLNAECIIGLYTQTCGAVVTTKEKISEARATDESAQAQDATAIGYDETDMADINSDFKLFAGFQKVIAVVITDRDIGPRHVIEVAILRHQADDAFILARLVDAAGIHTVGSHVNGIACYSILNREFDLANLSRGGVIGHGHDRARKLQVAPGFVQAGIDGFLAPLCGEEACAEYGIAENRCHGNKGY